MPAQPARYSLPDERPAVVHDLPPIKFEGQGVAVRLAVRRTEDGTWRGRIHFGAPDTEHERATAEIFCAATEPDLWQSVRDLRDHHLRDLYRSLLQSRGLVEDPIAKLRHDLANPLSAVLAETQLLLLNESELDPEVVNSLKHIEGLARRMRDILQDTRG